MHMPRRTACLAIAVAMALAGPAMAQVPSGAPAIADSRQTVLVVGATRGTGLETVRELLKRGVPVAALARPSSDLTALQELAVPIIPGDALVPADLARAMASGPWRAVITSLGCADCANPPDFVGNRNLFDAMRASDTRRVILVSSIGVGESRAATPWIVEWILADVLELKELAEADLRRGGLDYTIVRPGGLTNASPTGNGVLTEDPTRMGIIARPDLAGLVVDVALDDGTIGRTFTALDGKKHWLWDMYGD
jgi:nucleoside-diphosphate-sugar epimerase